MTEDRIFTTPDRGQGQSAAGQYVKTLRERAGLSQRELAKRAGMRSSTFISKIESGRGRVQPERYAAFAQAFEISPREFVMEMLRCYDPTAFDILFSGTARPDD